MAYQNLLVEVGDDFVAAITLNRPESLNTFTSETARELHDALWELEREPRCRVILIKGAGKAFCAGIDVNEVFDKSPSQYKAWVEGMELPLVAMSQIGKPVIAQVHGVAAANGGGIVAAADLAIASDKARIGYTAVKVGLFCLGPAVPLRRVLGRKKTLELLLFGELIKAEEAMAIGLVNKVVPDADLDKEARRWAVRLARMSPVAVQLSKKAFYSMEEMGYHQGFDYMNEAFARLCSTEDAMEGIKAFLGKRDPEWSGR